MEIEIKLMWCKGLTGFNFFQKLSIYANVSIKHDDDRLELTQRQKQEQKTRVDDEGDGNPEWNHTLTFDLRPLEPFASRGFEDLSIVFELRHQGQLFGDKTVGEVRVPLRILIDSVGGNVTRFVSYEVRSPDDKSNGILDFSYRVLIVENHSTIIGPSNDDSNRITGYNRPDENGDIKHSHSHSHGHYDINDEQEQGHGASHHHHRHSHSYSHGHYDHVDDEHGAFQHHNSHGYYGLTTDLNVSEYHHLEHEHGVIHQHRHQHYQMDQHNSSGSGRIQYPRIDLEDYTPTPPQVVYPQPVQHHHYPLLPNFLEPPPPMPPVVDRPPPHWGYYRPPPRNYPPNW